MFNYILEIIHLLWDFVINLFLKRPSRQEVFVAFFISQFLWLLKHILMICLFLILKKIKLMCLNSVVVNGNIKNYSELLIFLSMPK